MNYIGFIAYLMRVITKMETGMKVMNTALLLGTLLTAGVMVAVNAGDKKTINVVAASKIQAPGDDWDASDEPRVLEVAFENGEKVADDADNVLDAKITNMFALADTDSDGVLTEAEYVDYQTLQARVQFSAMAGDDSFASLQEIKDWHLAKHTQSQDTDQKSDGATGE